MNFAFLLTSLLKCSPELGFIFSEMIRDGAKFLGKEEQKSDDRLDSYSKKLQELMEVLEKFKNND